jgi:chemosensory pili system protein ChpA (sensor histidine kinase/response regulator)
MEEGPDLESDLADLLEPSQSTHRWATAESDDDDLESLFGQSFDEALTDNEPLSENFEADSRIGREALEADAAATDIFPADAISAATEEVAADGAQTISKPATAISQATTGDTELDVFFEVAPSHASPDQAEIPQATEEIDDFFDGKERTAVSPSPARVQNHQEPKASDGPQEAITIAPPTPSPEVSPSPEPQDFLEEPETTVDHGQDAELDALFDGVDEAPGIAPTNEVTGSVDAPTEDAAPLAGNSDHNDLDLSTDVWDVESTVTPGVAATTPDFDDLDDLLNEPAVPAEPPAATEPQEEEEDSFDDLAALLEANADLPGESSPQLTGQDEYQVSVEEDSDDDLDEFSDLEKLLEDTDQLGGSSPTLSSRRVSAAPAARRAPRRTATVTDQTMRVSVSHLDILSNLVGELVVNRNSLEQDQERLRQFLDNLLFQVQQLNDVGQRMRDLYERSLLESSLISSRQAMAANPSSSHGGGNSHATGATFDALEMDRFTGFHTLSQEMIELIVRVREAASDIEFTVDSSDQITRQFRQVTTQLQEGLNKARMVPFGQTADRLPRAVRDISLKCGKEAKLVVEGRDTLIDKMILERLYDPVTHLVNNAITHGIEPPTEREARGKRREGTITIRAFYQGNQTVIYIADDGGGINPEIVKQKALQRGLISPNEAASMSEVEVYDLLFLPGFSTRDRADDFSGRGVGMDVVRTALSEIRGAITIESKLGQGTSFTIRLPLTLSITKALSCVNNQARIAFPMDGVEDMLDVPKERIQTNEQGVACILWRDTLLPFRPLSELLQFNRSLGRGRVYGGANDDNAISIVVLRSASTFVGLQVDQVIGEQEIVIKQLEGPVPKPTGIAGATVTGDGRVMPIADVLELIDLSTGRVRRESAASLWGQAEAEIAPTTTREEPTVLIVDDSITVRELLSMSFNKVGYRVEQARDGQEAWEKLRSGLPCDLVFCDIEMPRMDGLELLSRLQKDEQLSRIPIAMLTSRGADRHRQMAVELGASGYFTKPYLEEMLLDAARRMLEGEKMIGTTAESQP